MIVPAHFAEVATRLSFRHGVSTRPRPSSDMDPQFVPSGLEAMKRACAAISLDAQTVARDIGPRFLRIRRAVQAA